MERLEEIKRKHIEGMVNKQGGAILKIRAYRVQRQAYDRISKLYLKMIKRVVLL